MSTTATPAPRLAVLLYLALMLPPEFSLMAGSLRLSPYRVLLLLITVPLLLKLMDNRRQPVCLADWLIIAHACWAAIALTVFGGFGTGLESGGIYVVESLGAYLVGRIAVTSAMEHRGLLRFMVAALGVTALFTLPESLTGTHFIREAARAVMGGPGLPVIEPRLGLDRAFGPFDHPILYGVFASSTLAAVYYVLNRERLGTRPIMLLGLIVGSTFLSLSAGPFVGLACQAAVIGWDRITKGIQLRWWGLTTAFCLVWFAVSLGSNRSPIKVFISYVAFSPESSYNRVLIWEYGTAEVGRHPLFGIGLGDWIRAPWMSASMDNFWLVTAVRYGLPALCFLVGAIVVLAVRQARISGNDTELNRHRMAWLATIVGFAVSGFTVHFWNSLFVYFFFLIGSGVWMTHRQQRTRPHPLSMLHALHAAPRITTAI